MYDTIANYNKVLIDVKDLKKYFRTTKGFFRKVVEYIQAVDNIDFQIYEGEILGLVGESGCGKTTTGRTMLRLIEPTSGKVLFRSDNRMIDVTTLEPKRLNLLRKQTAMVFQDPYSSLDPRLTVRDIVGEPLMVHKVGKKNTLNEKVEYLLKLVNLKPQHMRRYPHQFSGGQRQRIGIARALALNPRFVVADEPVSALDVSIQAQILNLMKDLQKEFQFSCLFIAHDLSVIEYISDRIAVMYLGKIVELARTEELCQNPKHPYTEALISAIPVVGVRRLSEDTLLKGDVPSPVNPPSGCRFHPRCRYTEPICTEQEPPLTKINSEENQDHLVACHFSKELALKGAET